MISNTLVVLDLLRTELDFIEKGGYGRSPRTPQTPRLSFRDSVTCLNYASSERVHPCDECHLIDFAPPDSRLKELPCHDIELNESGDTVEQLEVDDNQQRLEAALKNWLKGKIQELENSEEQSQHCS